MKLKALPLEVKELVNDGVYSLYSLKQHAQASHVLITDTRDVYLLDNDGNILGKNTSSAGLSLGDSITFPEDDSRQTLKVNYA